MPPKAQPSQASLTDETAASLENDCALSSETSTGSTGDSVPSECRPLDQALSDAVYSLLGLPLDKLEEQLQELK